MIRLASSPARARFTVSRVSPLGEVMPRDQATGDGSSDDDHRGGVHRHRSETFHAGSFSSFPLRHSRRRPRHRLRRHRLGDRLGSKQRSWSTSAPCPACASRSSRRGGPACIGCPAIGSGAAVGCGRPAIISATRCAHADADGRNGHRPPVAAPPIGSAVTVVERAPWRLAVDPRSLDPLIPVRSSAAYTPRR